MADATAERAQALMRKHSLNELQDLARKAGAGRISRKTKFALATDVILAEDRQKPEPELPKEYRGKSKNEWDRALEEAMRVAFDGAKDELPKGGRRPFEVDAARMHTNKAVRPSSFKRPSIKGFEWDGKYYRRGMSERQFITPDGQQFHRNERTREWEMGPGPDAWDKAIQDKQRQQRENLERNMFRQEFPPDLGARQRERALENEIQKLRAENKRLKEENAALQGDIDFLLGNEEGERDSEVVEVKDLTPDDKPRARMYGGHGNEWCKECDEIQPCATYINQDAWTCDICGHDTTGMEAAKRGKL